MGRCFRVLWLACLAPSLARREIRKGKDALEERLKPLDGSCFHYWALGEWWGYTWCHKRFVRQFQREETEPRVEHALGQFSAQRTADDAKLNASAAHTFVDGESCRRAVRVESGKPRLPAAKTRRSSKVRFECCLNSSRVNELAANRANVWIESVREEPRLCEYAITVCARLACPAFLLSRFATKPAPGFPVPHPATQDRGDSGADFDETAGGDGGFPKAAEDVVTTSSSAHLERSWMSAAQRLSYREAARRMFITGYDAYMEHAFPHGELLPIECAGGTFDLIKLPLVTLIDSLDMLAIMGNRSEFQRAIGIVVEELGERRFAFDANVSVFETNIRLLGGLLSAHMLACDQELALAPEYDGALLALALDLGERLLPAFETATGIPYGTVNLARGVPPGETMVSSLAGSGSLALEFSVLSQLTGDDRFATAGSGAAAALFARRSPLGLLGKHVNIKSGKWVESLSGVGSNSDSFYEYLLKMYVLFGDTDSWLMFVEVYDAVLKHVADGDWYADVDMYGGQQRRRKFENLQAFWPGIQALGGDVAYAARSLNAFYGVWADWGALPEEFDYAHMRLIAGESSLRYPLRPELLESTYVLFRTTNEPHFMNF